MKEYWQVELTDCTQKVSSFVTADGLYECKVMPFGMNATATFQRLMGCTVCIDDIVILIQT